MVWLDQDASPASALLKAAGVDEKDCHKANKSSMISALGGCMAAVDIRKKYVSLMWPFAFAPEWMIE